MVVAGILALALALPTGALFGVGYGTGVRIGYEQIYPLLFPPKDASKDSRARGLARTVENIQIINRIYDSIGGKEASQMGIAVGLTTAMKEIDKNPDFQDLLTLEYSLSGNTPSNYTRNRYGLDNISQSGDNYSDAVEDTQDKLDDITEDIELTEAKRLFRLSMLRLSDSKFKLFYDRRKSRYNTWQQQIMVLIYKQRYGNTPDEPDFPVKPPSEKDTYTAIYQNKETQILSRLVYQKRVTYSVVKNTANHRLHIKKLNLMAKELMKFYLSYRGVNGIKLTSSWRNHNAQQISKRAWTKWYYAAIFN